MTRIEALQKNLAWLELGKEESRRSVGDRVICEYYDGSRIPVKIKGVISMIGGFDPHSGEVSKYGILLDGFNFHVVYPPSNAIYYWLEPEEMP